MKRSPMLPLVHYTRLYMDTLLCSVPHTPDQLQSKFEGWVSLMREDFKVVHLPSLVCYCDLGVWEFRSRDGEGTGGTPLDGSEQGTGPSSTLADPTGNIGGNSARFGPWKWILWLHEAYCTWTTESSHPAPTPGFLCSPPRHTPRVCVCVHLRHTPRDPSTHDSL